MAELNKRQVPQPVAEDEQEAAKAARQEFGIRELDEDEELSDDSVYSVLQERMALAQQEATGGEPASAVKTRETESRENQPPSQPSRTEELLLDEIVFLPEHAGKAPKSTSLPAPPRTPGEVTRVEAEIHNARNRGDIARHSLRLARRYASAVALFVVNRGMVVGLRCEAEGALRPIESIMVPAEVDNFFAPTIKSGKPLRGFSPKTEADMRIFRAMGRPRNADRLLVPIVLRGRVINLLYADNGSDELAETSAAALCALGACIASAYEYSILALKRSQR